MERACDSCGKVYAAKRASSRYCGDLCRKRAQRGGASKPAEAVREQVDERIDAAAGTLVMPAVLEELTKANAQDSAAGRVALALALRLDMPSMDTGSAVASVAKQLLEAIKVATADVPAAVDDPLAAIRARRAGERGA